jgi:hypothetical protein
MYRTVKNKERTGSFFGLVLSLSLLLISCASYVPQSGQSKTQLSAKDQPSNIQPGLDNRQWRSATYRDLEVGKSTRQDMLRVLGEPKASVDPQARITTNPNTITAYHYGGPKGYAGDLIVGVEKATRLIAWIETSPQNLSRDDVIKQFGSNYVLTSYKPDDCFIDGQPRVLYETSAEVMNPTYPQMEYRQIGTVVQFRPSQEVYRIIYISDKWPYGNTSSSCNQPRKRLAYIACDCGCCGGVQPKRQCIYQSKGDGLQQIVQRDKDAAKNSNCALAGCSIGTRYVYCD